MVKLTLPVLKNQSKNCLVAKPIHVKKPEPRMQRVSCHFVVRQLSLILPFLYGAVTVDGLPELASRAISTIAKNASFFTCSCTEA
jgi:hypothetical protein